MSSRNFTNVLLVLVILLLALNLLVRADSKEKGSFLEVSSAYAQGWETGEDFIFYPVGDQVIRRFVFLDKRDNMIYDYAANGRLASVWKFNGLGKNLKRIRR